MARSNYTNGFSAGVLIKEAPLFDLITGEIFWVDSVAGAAGNPGTFERPLSTIDLAVGKCTASNGDMIYCKPGHVETVIAAAGLALDVQGITVVGLGSGSDRCTINFTTAVTADMDVSAANITIANILFTGGIDALTGPININAADFAMFSCETRDVTGQTTDFIVTTVNADRLLIDGWIHRGAAGAGAQTAINVVGGDDIEIMNFNLYGDFIAGAIENATTAAVRISVHDGYIWTEGAEDLAVIMHADTTGRIGPNISVRLQDDAANITEAFVGAKCQFFQPISICNADGEVGLNTNITATTDAIV